MSGEVPVAVSWKPLGEFAQPSVIEDAVIFGARSSENGMMIEKSREAEP